MSNIEGFCVTGTAATYFLRPEFTDTGCFTICQADVGCLDAPKRIAAGSALAECWYGPCGQRTIEREAA